MGIECAYSFDDLYFAAFGKKISQRIKNKLQGLSQEKINTLVLVWAKKANWITENKKGENGVIYCSFHP